jgi:predicted metalloendopeptidase
MPVQSFLIGGDSESQVKHRATPLEQDPETPIGYHYYHGGHHGARAGYVKHERECVDENGTKHKTTHGYAYGCHDYDDYDAYWAWGLFCIFFFFLILLFLPLLFYPYGTGYGCSGKSCNTCPCNGGYGYMTLEAEDGGCGCSSSSYLTPTFARGTIPDKDGKCSPGEELWHPPNTNELPRCVFALRSGNGSHPDMVDSGVSACADFYRHASGKWLAGAPRDTGRFFGDAATTSAEIQQTIATVELARTWEHDRLGAMEYSCISAYAAPSYSGEQGVAKYVSSLVSQMEGTGRFDLAKASGVLLKHGLVAPVFMDVMRAPDRDDAWIVMVDVGKTFTSEYDTETRRAIVSTVFRSDAFVDEVLEAEDAIQDALDKAASDHIDAENEVFFKYMKDSHGFTSHVFWGRELQSAFKGWSWDSMHKAIGEHKLHTTRHWVRSPAAVRALAEVSQRVSPKALLRYFEFSVMVQYFEFMPDTYGFTPVESTMEQINHDLGSSLTLGLEDEHVMPWSQFRRPAWHRASLNVKSQESVVDHTDSPSILAQRIEPRDMPQLKFAQRCARQQEIFMPDERNVAFSGAALKKNNEMRIKSLIKEIIQARGEMIQESDLSEGGKAVVLEKLNSIKIRVGHAPRRVRGAVDAETPYWRNVANIREMDAMQRYAQLQKNAAETRGDAPFLMPTSAINAYYDPTDNTISVLAGITLYPFFSPEYNDATLFATLGAIVGHEIGHATDKFGIKFDKSGAITDWVPKDDTKLFEESNACFERQYSGPAPETHQYASGKQTVTEAAADNVGVTAALRALRNVRGEDKLPEDVVIEFGLQFAQMWAVHQSKETENRQISYDPHPVALFRVNKAFENTPELLEVYGCGAQPVCGLAA